MRVYVRIARRYAGRDRHAFPEVADLAEQLGLSERTVKRAVALLREVGAIIVTRSRQPDGYYGRNSYWLPLDDPQRDQGSPVAPGSVGSPSKSGPTGSTATEPTVDHGTHPAPRRSEGGSDPVGAAHQGATVAPPGWDTDGPSKEQPDPENQPDNFFAGAPSLRDGLPTENHACAAGGVTDRGELAGDVTTRARERGPAREAPPPPRQSPEDYPEPSPQDRVIYANTLLQACKSCGAPPGRLCVRPGETLPLPAIRAPHHTRGRWPSSGAEPSGAGAGQTRKGARKRRVSA